ncbi:hypothetical protein HVMH_1852 [Hydrogenovibrio marinus]|nr:hypothetical protein HVMH_1852 [Hydrogenovibrio marinus]
MTYGIGGDTVVVRVGSGASAKLLVETNKSARKILKSFVMGNLLKLSMNVKVIATI